MDLIEVSGSHYEIGFQIGKATAAKIAAVLFPKPLTPGFRKRLAALLPIHGQAFPHLLEEIRGMADGSGQEFEKLLVWNFFETGLLGCTSIIYLNHFLAHNEDGPKVFRNLLTLVRAHLPNGDRVLSLQYPGMLIGASVSISSRGLVFSVNTLVPKRLANVGYASNFVARELLAAPSLAGFEDCLAHLRPRINAYHWFVYSRPERQALSIESLVDLDSIVRLEEGVHFHTNHYLHEDSREEPQEEYSSSQARWGQLPRFFQNGTAPTKERAALALSDHQGKWPICRHGEGDSLTLANVIVDLDSLRMQVAEGPTCQSRECLKASV